MNNTLESSRNKNFDLIRGIAMLMVVMSHIVDPNISLHSFLYSIHNSLFFVVGGFLFYDSCNKKRGKSFGTNKIKSIMIPYLFWSVVAAAVHIISEFDFSILNILDWFKITIIYAGSIWFFASYATILIIYLALLKVSEIKKIYGILLTVIVYILPIDCFAYSRTKWFIPIFGIGYLLAKYKSKYIELMKYLRWISILWIPMAVYGGNHYLIFDEFEFSLPFTAWWLYYVVIAFLGFVFADCIICTLLNKVHFVNNELSSIGMNTVALYPISIFFSQYLTVILYAVGINIAYSNRDLYQVIIYGIIICLYSIFSLEASKTIDSVLMKNRLYWYMTRGKK